MQAVIDPINFSNVCDTITIELRDTTIDKNIVHTSKQILNTNGTCSFTFTPPNARAHYYIVIKHRNSLETWSALPILFSGVSIDFAFSGANVFLNNVKDLGDGNFAIISGDVDQNGVINLVDNVSLNNSAMYFLSGYISEDLSGDGVVESVDFSVVENNIGKMVTRP